MPEGMPVTQVVEAMSRGVIDGTTGHPIAIYDFGISRVANSHYLGKIGTVTLGIFMSKAKFESLPPQAKAAIEKNRGEALVTRIRQDVRGSQCRADRRVEKGSQAHCDRADQGTERGMGQDARAGRLRLGSKDARNKDLVGDDAQGTGRHARGQLNASRRVGDASTRASSARASV